ncbi:hypothetical protein GCM10023317_28560 [Actinopolymorpha pittospori]
MVTYRTRTSGALLSDVDFEAFSGSVDADQMYLQATVMFRCPHSGHLWIYWNGMDEPPAMYWPEPYCGASDEG